MKMLTINKKNFILFLKLVASALGSFIIILFFYTVLFFDSHYIKNKNEKLSKKQEIEEKLIKDAEIKKKEELEQEKKLSDIEANKEKIIKRVESVIEDGLYATVGNKAITKSDIVNEIKKILILNNKTYSDSEKQNLQNIAIKALIKRNVKKIEVEKNNFLDFNENDFNNELYRLANNINIDLNKLKEICELNDLDFSIIEDQIKTDLRWNSLIFQVYKDRLTINLDEIEEQIKLVQAKKEVEEYLVSEIIIPKVEKDKINSAISDLKNKIENDTFENIAIKLSIADSASEGGNLGWISENTIIDRLKPIIINTPVGSLSKAVLLTNGILIFKVNKKRKIEINRNLEEIKNNLVNAEKTKILQMHSLSHFNNSRRSITVKFLQ